MKKNTHFNPQRQGNGKRLKLHYLKTTQGMKSIEDDLAKISQVSSGITDKEDVLNDLFIVALIPAYNEGKSIKNIISQTRNVVDHIIVCNDGSSDMTGEIVFKMDVELINHIKNSGKGQALKTLYAKAVEYNPDIIVTLDGDGQHDPLEIPRLINEILDNESDVVIGSRFLQNSVTDISPVRSFGLKTINLLERLLLKSKISDNQSGFRAFSKNAFKIFNDTQEKGYGVETEQNILAVKHDLKISEVPVTITYKNLPNNSKKHFIKHGFELIIVILRNYGKHILRQNT
ncbi:MAG: glycosyltransferase family 2 protein [Candidatus Hodarchaeales archaeon]